MRRRVFVVAGEYSANPRQLTPERKRRAFLTEPLGEPSRDELSRLFFRFPNRGDDGRTRPADWERAFGVQEPVGLADLLVSAAHRALTTLHTLRGGDYRQTRDSITDVFVTSMPGLDPNERVNVGLLPQALRALLGLSPRAHAQFIAGTSDSGAWTFAQAVRAARNSERPATVLVLAGQVIPAGYLSQYQIRTVLGEADQAHGLDMLAVGDLLMDGFRRNLGLAPGEVKRFLARVAAHKQQASVHYPAGISSGKPFRRDSPRTPWFDASDIAIPCCGAAATILTSDEELVEAISATRSPRFRTAPVTEVLGVGEGSSNQNLLHRKSPLVFATAVRDALADTADDARRPFSTFASCAFGVVHDAFPSIELSFLMALGLGWERSSERMAEGWSNPIGGLLGFGHALAASGLVQVNKTHHLFCVDSRYLTEEPGKKRQGFREDGALAFTTSVGGPLSHIVGGLFLGGYHELRPRAPRARRGLEQGGVALSAAFNERRHQLRLVLPSYLRGVPGAWFLEGTTSVSIRSCLRALGPEDFAQLEFPGIEELIVPHQLDGLRLRLRATVAIVQRESERLSSMFDVFRLLTDEVREVAVACRAQGLVLPAAAALSDDKLADRLKECLRVALAVLCRESPQGAVREVRFLHQSASVAALADVQLVDERCAPRAFDPVELPFWNRGAARPVDTTVETSGESIGAIVDRIVERSGGPRTAGELELLRAWFAPDPPRVLINRALRALHAPLVQPPDQVRAVVYFGEIVSHGQDASPEGTHELFGAVAREASAYLEAYQSRILQIGSGLMAVSFERPPFRAEPDDALLSSVRFAHEIARGAHGSGVRVRAVICAGEGTVFEDVGGQEAVATPAAPRAALLLSALRAAAPDRAALALQNASEGVLAQVGQRLLGWEILSAPIGGARAWVAPAGSAGRS